MNKNFLLEVLIKAKDEFSSALKKMSGSAKTSFKDIEKSGDSASKSMKKVESAGGDLVKQILPFTTMAGGVLAVGAALKKAADDTLAYANQVRELKAQTGATAEESSKLIQVAGDVGIQFAQLETAMVGAVRKGYRPTIEGLAQMSDEYRQIQDPIQQTTYLLDHFGKSGDDVRRLMELGSVAIEKAGKSIEGTARLMDEDALQAAEEYRQEIDNLTDSMQDLELTVGREVIPILNDLFQNQELYTATVERMTAANMQMNNATFNRESKLMQLEKDASKAAKKYMDERQRYYQMLDRNAKLSSEHMVAGMETQQEAIARARMGFQGYYQGVETIAEATRRAQQATLAASIAANHYQSELQRLNNIDFSIGSTIENDIKKIKWDQLGGGIIEQMRGEILSQMQAGLIDHATAMAALKELGVAADVFTGYVNNEDFSGIAKNVQDDIGGPLSEAKTKANDLINAIKAGTFTPFIYNVIIKVTGGGNLPKGQVAGHTYYGGGYASGGEFTVPPGYPNDSYVAGFTSGEDVQVTPAGNRRQAGHSLLGGGGDTFIEQNIYAAPGMNEQALARYIQMNSARAARRQRRSGRGYTG